MDAAIATARTANGRRRRHHRAITVGKRAAARIVRASHSIGPKYRRLGGPWTATLETTNPTYNSATAVRITASTRRGGRYSMAGLASWSSMELYKRSTSLPVGSSIVIHCLAFLILLLFT